jgi:hypothetical protein
MREAQDVIEQLPADPNNLARSISFTLRFDGQKGKSAFTGAMSSWLISPRTISCGIWKNLDMWS